MSIYHRIFQRYNTSDIDFSVALIKDNLKKEFICDAVIINISLQGLLLEIPNNYNFDRANIIELKNESMEFVQKFSKVWSSTEDNKQLLGIMFHFSKAANYLKWLKFVKEQDAKIRERKKITKQTEPTAKSVLAFHSGEL